MSDYQVKVHVRRAAGAPTLLDMVATFLATPVRSGARLAALRRLAEFVLSVDPSLAPAFAEARKPRPKPKAVPELKGAAEPARRGRPAKPAAPSRRVCEYEKKYRGRCKATGFEEVNGVWVCKCHGLMLRGITRPTAPGAGGAAA